MAEWLLYEHKDGRYAAAPNAATATFAHGDPQWHRIGAVEMPSPASFVPGATVRSGVIVSDPQEVAGAIRKHFGERAPNSPLILTVTVTQVAAEEYSATLSCGGLELRSAIATTHSTISEAVVCCTRDIPAGVAQFVEVLYAGFSSGTLELPWLAHQQHLFDQVVAPGADEVEARFAQLLALQRKMGG